MTLPHLAGRTLFNFGKKQFILSKKIENLDFFLISPVQNQSFMASNNALKKAPGAMNMMRHWSLTDANKYSLGET